MSMKVWHEYEGMLSIGMRMYNDVHREKEQVRGIMNLLRILAKCKTLGDVIIPIDNILKYYLLECQ